MTITNGKVTYGRSVQPKDYETKRAEVEIAFTVADDGSDAQEKLDAAAQMAISKAHELLGLAAPAPATVAKVSAAANAGKTKQDLAAEAQAATAATAPPKTRGRKAAAPPAPLAPEPEADLENTGAPAGDNEMGEFADDLAGAAPEITDARLGELVRDQAQKVGPAPVRTLIGAYGAIAPKTYRDIPQEKRQAFVTELGKLQKAS